ncbi:histidine phosphatase family protein [Patescibacteria group bacterium]|nr:histidine phosphatase family protein [Patescibacteria group bacterium]MBU2220432.1 histidine phosphatase family protein [Patescibacteria group bacterium]
MESKKAYFVRHGQTQFNVDRRITGHVDIPLTNEGIDQAKKAAQELPEDCAEIFSSDSLRCRQTAEILNEGRNLPVTFDARLRERHFGSLEGQLWDDADPSGEIWEADKNQRYDYRQYGGEAVTDVQQRVEECIRDIKGKCTGKPLVVTSGGVIRLLKNKLHGEVHGNIKNSSVHEFDLPDSIETGT